MALEHGITAAWYQGSRWLVLLRPLSWIYRLVTHYRKRNLLAGSKPLNCPVVVVGNITVGGTGKTPLIIALIKLLRQAGYKPGVISRGYGSAAPRYPYVVSPTSNNKESGDEPLLIAIEGLCPVVIDPQRRRAAEFLLSNFDCDIILSDDGLQHYNLHRDLEICVVDGERGLGNGVCLPAGPLREPPSRLSTVDWVVINGRASEALDKTFDRLMSGRQQKLTIAEMAIAPCVWVNVQSPQKQITLLETPHFTAPVLISGIGNPQRFFQTVNALGISAETKAFVDHHRFTVSDFDEFSARSIIMTTKDAVKCQEFAGEDWWALSVQAELPESFTSDFLAKIGALVAPAL